MFQSITSSFQLILALAKQ